MFEIAFWVLSYALRRLLGKAADLLAGQQVYRDERLYQVFQHKPEIATQLPFAGAVPAQD
ncbi:hypothetical protein JY651_16505 [Pyxidicoccus parkwayensis]|uniref:Uncharacterized protein n=1 Tax=Pyxidicoccus parkwayensis TaxID=2813578 RepID=A0ABX7P7I9_9BACT|nr:hypothetical protein [Pyxidicoccus parkwaysis]QSQ26428.1 hypothetical protein JY651_16505 [Pyxidicoccus parkwaysis]